MAKGAQSILNTSRELHHAWRNARFAAKVDKRNNMHRLMLFYAAECGLKAIYLKNKSKTVFGLEEINELGHKLNQILDKVNGGSSLHLPQNLQLKSCTSDPSGSRSCAVHQINQVWRYGAELLPPNDDVAIEAKLLEIDKWIENNI